MATCKELSAHNTKASAREAFVFTAIMFRFVSASRLDMISPLRPHEPDALAAYSRTVRKAFALH